MKQIVFATFVLLTLVVHLSADDVYENLAYGLSAKATGDWQVTKSAKLEIDLHSLDDEQLFELFGAYRSPNGSVLTMVKGTNRNTSVTVFFEPLDSKRPTAMAYAQYLERSSAGNGFKVIESARNIDISGAPATYLARIVRPGFVSHQYFVQRARSLLRIDCTLPESLPPDDTKAALDMIESMKIDVGADSLRK